MVRGKSDGAVDRRTRGRNSEENEARDKDEEVKKVVEEMKKTGARSNKRGEVIYGGV